MLTLGCSVWSMNPPSSISISCNSSFTFNEFEMLLFILLSVRLKTSQITYKVGPLYIMVLSF